MLFQQGSRFRYSRQLFTWSGVFLLASSVLVFEINLVRIFSVSQFYHFAFLIVSIAMMGSGAGGTILAMQRPGSWLRPASRNTISVMEPVRSFPILPCLSLGTAVLMVFSYILVNLVPFDSFLVIQKPGQWLVLAAHYLALSLPFLLSGMVMGILLYSSPGNSGKIYSANLLGSAAGCLLAFLLPGLWGGQGIITASSLIALISSGLFFVDHLKTGNSMSLKSRWIYLLLLILWGGFLLPDLILRSVNGGGYPLFILRLSPYKSFSYAIQVPDAKVIFEKWNAYSRVDVIHSPSIHSLPGLSYRYLDPLPLEDGLLIDGDDLTPLLSSQGDWQNADFTSYLLTALPYQLKPEPSVLILDSRSGLNVLVAQSLGAQSITAVEANPLIIQAANHIYGHQDQNTNLSPVSDKPVTTIVEQGRSYLRRTDQFYDIILVPLNNSYHPVRSGAYSLGEDYRYTVEAFSDALDRLAPGGILVVSRWLQNPPSESLRTLALVITAVEQRGGNPREQIIALRSYNMITFLVSNQPFTADKVEITRQFAGERAFDLVYVPGIEADEINQYNILEEPVYEDLFRLILDAQPRQTFYQTYPYDVTPPTDNQPFFSHYFKWSQTRQVMDELGKTWQPFGGAGYFVILALLLLAVIFAGLLISLPLLTLKRFHSQAPLRTIFPMLLYFGCIGLAFMLVEIPLIQQFILYLGNPSLSFTVVLFSLLLFSGIGSFLSGYIKSPRILVFLLSILVLLLLALTQILPWLVNLTLGLSPVVRILCSVLFLAPVGWLMGIAFPAGIRQINAMDPSADSPSIGWAWSVNGALSVIASILASLLALSFGFRAVFFTGALAYAAACLLLTFSLFSTLPQARG